MEIESKFDKYLIVFVIFIRWLLCIPKQKIQIIPIFSGNNFF